MIAGVPCQSLRSGRISLKSERTLLGPRKRQPSASMSVARRLGALHHGPSDHDARGGGARVVQVVDLLARPERF